MMHKPRFNPAWVGTGVVVAMLLIISGIVLSGVPGGPRIGLPWSKTFTVKAQMSTADALEPKAGVQIAGVKIGEVHSVEVQNNQAIVTMDLQPQYTDIHSDARVQLRPHGLFGPKYIELTAGTTSAPLLRQGDTIPGSQEVLPVDLDQILQELQANEQHQLTTAIVEFGKASAGRGSDFNQLVAAGNTLTSVLQSPLKVVDRVTANLSDMFIKDEAFNASFAQVPLDQLVEASNVSLRAFADTSAQLGDLLNHANSTLTSLDSALSGEAGNIRATLEKAPAVIDQLSQFNGLLARFSGALNGTQADVTTKSLLVDATTANPHALGLSAAIENPLSALSSWDGTCTPTGQTGTTPGAGSNAGSDFCSFDGHYHYFRVQTFTGANGHGNGAPPPVAGSLFVQNHDGTITSAYGPANQTNATDLLSFGALIGF
ncbi:MAG TPA: MlaD family protein [Candidatus Dormibacteraeota bacterium]|jgi:phospholipid/cholesterol/gamma-HCH transport system substrate-binding protein|nr:MlaD family protein [Candidatus Dormibacteraeota bacterium]